MLYNQIEESTKIKDSLKRWENYRKQVTEFILEEIEIEDKVTIVGAGECNDLDLSKLLPYVSEFTLVDKDIEALKQAVFQYQLSTKRCHLLEEDIWPISAKQFEERLRDGAKSSELMEFLKKETKKALATPLPKLKSDLTICVGVHSQLNSLLASLFYLYREPYGKSEREQISQVLSWMNAQAVKKMHNWIFEGSYRVILGYEYMTFGTTKEEKKKCKVVQQRMESGQIQEVESMNISRVEGGYQAENDLAVRYKSGEIILKKDGRFLWNFLPEKEYLMQFYVIRM